MTREEAEAIYGKIEIWFTGGMGANRIEAYFERYLDYAIPSWARAFGSDEQEAIASLLDFAEEKATEDGLRLLEHAIMHNYDRCREWQMSYDECTMAHGILFRILNEKFAPRF